MVILSPVPSSNTCLLSKYTAISRTVTASRYRFNLSKYLLKSTTWTDLRTVLIRDEQLEVQPQTTSILWGRTCLFFTPYNLHSNLCFCSSYTLKEKHTLWSVIATADTQNLGQKTPQMAAWRHYIIQWFLPEWASHPFLTASYSIIFQSFISNHPKWYKYITINVLNVNLPTIY